MAYLTFSDAPSFPAANCEKTLGSIFKILVSVYVEFQDLSFGKGFMSILFSKKKLFNNSSFPCIIALTYNIRLKLFFKPLAQFS